MHLYLVRHAHARDGDDDAARPLSEKGIAQIRDLGRWLRTAKAVDVHELWHSPLVRARDTAVRLQKELGLTANLRAEEGLTPGDAPEIIARRLGKRAIPVMLVGHEPHLSALATLLVTGQTMPVRFVMKKCAVLRLDREGNGWAVRWHVSPEIL